MDFATEAIAIVIMAAAIGVILTQDPTSVAVAGMSRVIVMAAAEGAAEGELATSTDHDRGYSATQVLSDAPQGLCRAGFALSARFTVPVLGLPAIFFAAGCPAFINAPELKLRFGVS